MYEYQTSTYYGATMPTALMAPVGFRFRDAKYVETSSSENHSISYGGQHGTPYAQSSMTSSNGHWVVIWERYVPEKEEE